MQNKLIVKRISSSRDIDRWICLTQLGLRRGIGLLAAVLVASLATPLHAGTERNQLLIQSLSTTCTHPPPLDYLNRFEPNLKEQLLAIIEDCKVPRLVRLRAIAALAKFADEKVALDYLVSLAGDVEAHATIRLAAIGTLGSAFGKLTKSLEVLEITLQDRDPGIRAGSVKAISQIGGADAEAILSRHRLVERNIVVRQALRGVREATMQNTLPQEGVQNQNPALDRLSTEGRKSQ